MNKPKSKKGGVRAGAGRPLGEEKVVRTFNIPADLSAALDDFSWENRMNRSVALEHVLREFFNKK